jgi:pimeloyl-ACP methyl ester carboxylesterase
MPEPRVSTSDGHVLQVLDCGAPSGHPVLVHNGTPASRLMFDPDVQRAAARGIRLISYDRPGYGGSTPRPGRSVADSAEDVRTIAGALGIDRLPVWGISGGGSHALACAALLSDLVPAVGVLASAAPWGAEGLDFFDGMGEMNVEDVQVMIDDPAEGRAKHERDRLEMLATEPEELHELMKTLLSEVDAAAMTPERAEFLVHSTRVALEPGADGWWDDDVAAMSPWGFEVEAITTPVLLLHGRQDRFVPFGHGQWLAAHIPGVEARLTDDDGHITLTERHLDEVHDWLLERSA